MTAQTRRLPPATLRALKALNATALKVMPWAAFRKATGVKSQAVRPFTRRLEEKNLIGVNFDSMETTVALTFAGMQALKAHEEQEA